MSGGTSSLNDPAAVYLHVPFCRHRCGYCNFTLIAGRDDLIDAYLEALSRELRSLQQPRHVKTIFVGGGTPTHLPATALQTFLDLVDAWFHRSSDSEYSVEANPSDITAEKVDRLSEAGVNRISLGVQSWNADKLSVLERDHRAATIRHACHVVRQRIDNLSIDLIFAAPHETQRVWLQDLQQTIDEQPQHISTYGLTFERGTSFWSRHRRGELPSANESTELEMYQAGIDTLTAAGYEHYEVSNFAQRGYRCQHNETYWSGEPYFAFGPGAARYLDGCRQTNHRSTTTYIRRMLAGKSPVAESEQLPPVDRAKEQFVIGMRRLEGVNQVSFAETTGFSIQQLFGTSVDELCDRGLLAQDKTHVRLTRAGLMVSDSIWSRLLTT